MKILFLPETTVRLKNLTSYTTYLVKLLAFNAAGDGPLSEPRKGRTLQAGEPSPSRDVSPRFWWNPSPRPAFSE